MTLIIERVSDSKILIHDGSTNLMEIDTTDGVRINGALKVGTSSALTGIGGAYKIARGEVTLDGGNPTPISTGLATVVACTVTDKRSTAPGVDPTAFTVDYGGGVAAGTVNVYAWKITATGDGTLVASTDSDDVISWIAIGT